MVVELKRGTIWSPCTPITPVCTSELLILINLEKYVFKRKESKWFPIPITLFLSNPEYFKATVVMTSTGFVAIKIIESGAWYAICLAYVFTILAFGIAKSRLFIPSFLGVPAVINTIDEPSISLKSHVGVSLQSKSSAARASYMSNVSPFALSTL